jgi:hypothetical protein
MIAPDMLQSPSVKTWLGGIEPAWTLLDQASFWALRHPPSPTAGPIRLAADLTPREIQQSAVAQNALIVLGAAGEGPGLKLTATGNLSRALVAEMCNRFTWPEFDRANAFWLNKVVNEPDFFPLFYVRHVVEAAKFLRKYKGHLRATPTGRKMREEVHQRALQAVLFHIAFWHLDFGYLGRGLHGDWPQQDGGIVLWSLSVAANDWQPSDRLTRMCSVPIKGVLDAPWDAGTHAMEARILRPLRWFGLLEHRQEDIADSPIGKRHFYRKSVLFDRFLSFDVKVEVAGGPRH